jgi:hypothetical protein
MGVLMRLSTRSSKPQLSRPGRWVAGALGVMWLAAGCDFQPLTARDLFGSRDAGIDVVSSVDAIPDLSPPDGNATDGTWPDGTASDGTASDGAPQTCATTCPASEFCDEITGKCVSRTGNSMLGGVVRDKCGGVGLDAKVGIAGQHQCSGRGKGMFFFAQLPVGKLKLAAVKEGYQLFDTTVAIAPGGTIQDIELVRLNPDGCAGPPPAEVMCMCEAPQCMP